MAMVKEIPIDAPAPDEAHDEGPGEPGRQPGDLGRRGEQAAQAFLRRHGFEILEANWRCPAGEVDIIARDDASLHFVEVKTRTGTGRGFPAEAVSARKRQRYERIAELYLETYDGVDIYICFDVISIIVTGNGRAFLRMHKNAFCFD